MLVFSTSDLEDAVVVLIHGLMVEISEVAVLALVFVLVASSATDVLVVVICAAPVVEVLVSSPPDVVVAVICASVVEALTISGSIIST